MSTSKSAGTNSCSRMLLWSSCFCSSIKQIYKEDTYVKRYLNQYYNQGHSTWIIPRWYLPFSLPMLFCNAFFGEIVKIPGQNWKGVEKGHRAQHVHVIPSTDPSFNVMNCRLRDSGHFVYIVDFKKKLFPYAVGRPILKASPKMRRCCGHLWESTHRGSLGRSKYIYFLQKKKIIACYF